MITESTVRQWYTPVEVSTLQRWLLVSFVVNIVLLAVDLLRGSQSNAMLGVLGVVVIGLLLNFLPEEANPPRRNIALVLGGALLLIGLVRLLSSPATGFDIWMQGWLVGPGALTLTWVSSRPVSAWSTRRMSLEAIEYGLARNQQHDGRLRSIGAHLVLLHFVALTL